MDKNKGRRKTGWCPAWELAKVSHLYRFIAVAKLDSAYLTIYTYLELLRPLFSSGWLLLSEALNHG